MALTILSRDYEHFFCFVAQYLILPISSVTDNMIHCVCCPYPPDNTINIRINVAEYFIVSCFLGGHHLYMNLCVCVCVCVCVIPSGGNFPRRNGRRGLKFCLHTQIGITRRKIAKIILGVPPPQKKIGYLTQILKTMKNIKVIQNCLKWRENWSK